MFNSRLLRKMALFLLFTAVYFFSYFHRVAIPGTIFNELQIDFNLTANQIASLGTLVFYIYGILQFFIGIWLDYFGTNIIFIVSGFLLGIGSMMFAFSNGIFSLYLSRVLVGFGASVAYLTVVKKTEELFGSHLFSLMLGFACFIGYSGGLFATLPFERLVYAFGWRHAIAGLSWIFFILMLAILTVFIKTNAFSRAKNRIVLSDIKTTLLNRQTYPLILIVTINFSIYFLFQGIFGKKLLQDICITSSKLAASFTFVMMVITMFFVFLAGILTHIIRKRKPIIVILCFCCLFSCVLMLANVLVWRSTGIFLFSFFLLAFAGG
ncbi:MAG TPA: MFS transporter, partial [bacterium]|nr:MFS transporter [bacterium]